jgi:hypothetical protein
MAATCSGLSQRSSSGPTSAISWARLTVATRWRVSRSAVVGCAASAATIARSIWTISTLRTRICATAGQTIAARTTGEIGSALLGATRSLLLSNSAGGLLATVMARWAGCGRPADRAGGGRGFNDPARAAKARAELDVLVGELARAVGLGGRDRRAAAPTTVSSCQVPRRRRSRRAGPHIQRLRPVAGDRLGRAVKEDNLDDAPSSGCERSSANVSGQR